jgi:hypothetical protein
MIKKTALIFLIYLLLLIVFIIVCWIRYFNDSGGEMVDSLYLIMLFIATIYYFGMTVWTYKIYKSSYENIASPIAQLGLILILGILSSICLLIKAYT